MPWLGCGSRSGSSFSKKALLFFYASFINEHDGNVIFDWVDSFALDALKSLIVWSDYQRFLAQRANQNLKEFLTDWHDLPQAERFAFRPIVFSSKNLLLDELIRFEIQIIKDFLVYFVYGAAGLGLYENLFLVQLA